MSQGAYHNITKYIVYSLVGATLVSAFLLANYKSTSAARQVNTTTSVTVQSTCSMTATVNTEHVATMVNGTYSSGEHPNGIGKTTIQTFCNDAGGYAIYAIGFTNNEYGRTDLMGAGLDSSYNIATGTATSGSGSSDVSNWAMKVTAVDGSYAPEIMNGFNDFKEVPDTYTKVAKLYRSADTSLGSSLTTTYAAYISNAQPAGTYTGQVKYALVHPSTQAAPDAYVMQDIAEWKGELLPGVQYTAVDNRDNKAYTVALLTDGQENGYEEIWMTQNLDLCIGCVGTAALTSENTDLNSYSGLTGYTYNNGVITWTPTGATMTGTPATVNFSSYTTSWVNDYNKPYMAEGQDTIIYNGTKYTSLQECETTGGHSEADCLHYKVGNYYNWSAAVAMNDTSSYTTDKTVMSNSICPAGWRLPNGLTTTSGGAVDISDFNKLLNAYDIAGGNDTAGGNVGYKAGGFNKIGNAPLFFARSGSLNSTTLGYFGTYGDYWSSTVSSSSVAYSLVYNSGVLYPANRVSRFGGRSVRCIAR